MTPRFEIERLAKRLAQAFERLGCEGLSERAIKNRNRHYPWSTLTDNHKLALASALHELGVTAAKRDGDR